jgi:hypothetical protein
MNTPQQLLDRLTAIGDTLSRRPTALALIGLGSTGLELDRLDPYSDLDFFVVVTPGSKASYLNDLSWLSAVAPIAYHFPNTPDGYKLLYADGIFCEFAVFEPAELDTIPFAPGRLIWRAPGVDATIATPRKPLPAPPGPPTTEFLLGEALTNLYVGLLRDHRGERLTALRFIQNYALDRTLQLAARLQPSTAVPADPFTPERRFEQRYPTLAPHLPAMLRGYAHNRESARAILTYLDAHFDVNSALKAAILTLCT